MRSPDHRQHNRFDPEILNQIRLAHVGYTEQASNYSSWKRQSEAKQVVHPKTFEMVMGDEEQEKEARYNPLI